jgi:hypothetical protein
MARPTLPTTYNNLITSYVNDDLLVEDETSATRYRYIYTSLPTTLTQYNLGGMQTFAYTGTLGVGAGGYVSSSIISVTPGIYFVHAYAQFTAGTSSTNTLQLGINTAAGAYSTTYYPTTDLNVASVTVRSIRYINVLSVSTTTNFYFVFNSQLAGNLTTNTFNGVFVRIA